MTFRLRMILTAALALLSAFVPLCGVYSQDDSDIAYYGENSSDEPADETSADEAGANEKSKKLTAEEKKAAREKAKADKIEAQRKARELNDAVTGKTYTVEKKVDIKSGSVALCVQGDPAAFNVYGVQKDGQKIPLLAAYDKFRSSFFSLMVQNTPYRLNREAGVLSEIRKTAQGAEIVYTIENKAQVIIDFTPARTSKDVPDDMVKVVVYTVNIGKKTQKFALKAVFDTLLGENSPAHFSTAALKSVNSEIRFPSMKDERWIVSSNGRTAVQLLLNGADISSPKFVYLGNKDILSLPSWEPSVIESRSFSSVLAYNNSAIGVNWPEVSLEGGQIQQTVFYIVAGVDGEKPAGLAFLEPYDNKQSEEAVNPVAVPENPMPVKAVEPAPVVITPPAAPAPVVPEQSPSYEPVPESAEKPSVEFIVPPVTDEQLDPVYIQNLIDRINSLQSDPNLVDRMEVKQLNKELDAILERIRQQPK